MNTKTQKHEGNQNRNERKPPASSLKPYFVSSCLRVQLLLILTLTLALFPATLNAQPVPADAPYKNPDLPLETRIDDLVSRMTLAEKLAQLEIESGANERLGFPAMNWWSEGLHGVSRAGKATQFVVAIGLAATFDTELMQRVGSVIGDEARAKHNENPIGRYRGLTYWAPCVNMCRDPRWGRIEEAYGEDPYHTGQMALAYMRGMQGDDPRYLKTATTPKHLFVHSHETERTKSDIKISNRQLFEYYLPAFRDTVVIGKAPSVMTAFSGVNGVPCTAHKWMLTEVLRNQWGFDGAVVTDWGAPFLMVSRHNYVQTREQAVVAALEAGVDVLCEHKGATNELANVAQSGSLKPEVMDAALRRALKVRFRLGMFDPPERVKYTQYPPSMIGAPAHQALALESALKAFVLLKNEPVKGGFRPLLPLEARALNSVAILGPYGEEAQLGAYSGDPANPAVTPLKGIRDHLPPQVAIRFVRWESRRNDVDAAIAAATASDVAIVVLGINNKIEHEGHDRKDIDLPVDQQAFIEKIVAANPNTVVVLEGGSPIAINWIQQNVPAILAVWYPGEQGGNAMAQVLFGQHNPSAKLPLTYYKGVDDLPPIEDYDLTKGRTYQYYTGEVLYPFGHGLSYTSFSYGDLKLASDRIAPDGRVELSFTLTNTGDRAGAEVAQLYVHDQQADVPRPIKQLRGFAKVMLEPGESKVVTMSLPASDLAFWDEASQSMKVEPGEMELQIGASSADIRLRKMITLQPE